MLDILLDNALEHGRGIVTVRVDDLETAVLVIVADEGTLDHDPARLFGRRPTGAEGTGIGLHLARTLVEAEGGRLRACGTAPTAFEISLPWRVDVPWPAVACGEVVRYRPARPSIDRRRRRLAAAARSRRRHTRSATASTA